MSGVMPLTTENLRLYVVASRNILKSDLEHYKKKLRSLPAGEHTNLAEKRDLQQKIGDIRMKMLQSHAIDNSIDALSKISFGTFEMLAPSIKRHADVFWPTSPAKYLKLDMGWTRGEVDLWDLYEAIRQLTPPISPTLKYDFSPVQELSPMDEPQHEVNQDDVITEEGDPETQVVDGLQNTPKPDEDEPATQPMD